MWKAHGVPARLVSPGELLDATPILAGGDRPVAGVISDGVIVHHDAAIHGLYLEARSLGVRLVADDAVVESIDDGDRLTGVVTATGRRVDADVVVNAAGARSGDVAQMLGVEIPNRRSPPRGAGDGAAAAVHARRRRVLHTAGGVVQPDATW